MRERLFITISDERNVRQYSVNRFVGRLLVYALSGHTLLFVVGLAGLGWMANEYDALQFAHDSLATTLNRETAATRQQQEAAQAEIEKLRLKIQEKREQLNIISQVAEAGPAKISFSVPRFSTQTHLNATDALLFERTLPAGPPMAGQTVSSGFGKRIHPIFRRPYFHYGIDFEAPMNTPVTATADGVVEYVRDSSNGYGRLVTLRHAHDFRTAYAHLHEPLVLPGQVVRKGDVIALSGNTGSSTGPHLHYEILYQGNPVNHYPFVAMEGAESPVQEARSTTAWASSTASQTP
jgi:murein DD-endopeptidase MepM/ murein hydrolase activator NlpD